MPVRQITIRLDPPTKSNFEDYAGRLGLDTSELAKLLIVRERILQRLSAQTSAHDLPKRVRQVYGSGARLPTVTAHMSTREQVEEFDAYAKSCGLNRNRAGVWLLETELQEKWLERALSSR
jgi:hypothetical protein